MGFGATGYAADVLQESVKSDANIVETVAHMMSATHYFGDIDVICDIGGQDIKVLFMQNGDIKNFRLSNQCSAGNGMLLQAMADQFGVPVTEYADVAFEAKLSPKFSYGCAVFLDSDRVNFQKEGYSKEELLAGLAQVLPKNVWQYVVQIPRMAELGKQVRAAGRHAAQPGRAQGAGRLHQGARARTPRCYVHPHTRRGGRDRRRDGDAARGHAPRPLDLHRHRQRDQPRIHVEERRRDALPLLPEQLCARTFIDTQTPDGGTSRYISGFSCEKGTVESEEAMLALTKERKQLMKEFPNLVDYESKQVFRHFYDSEPMPEATQIIDDVKVEKTLLRRQEDDDSARRSSARRMRTWEAAARMRVGIPKVLNIWTAGAVLADLSRRRSAFRSRTSSSPTTRREEMWLEGGKYGSIDPCYPSKVAQAHIHNLLFHHHEEEEGGKKLKYIFFPCITHVPAGPEQGHGHGVVPDRRGRARGHEGGVHQGDRLLRRSAGSSTSIRR